MKNIAVFASGEGTNAENIIRYFSQKKTANIAVVIYNRQNAGVKLRAERLGIPATYLKTNGFKDEKQLLPILENYQIDFIVLSGFLVLVPPFLIQRYPNHVVNIHPALIPKHCGKGMYGMKVHEDVVKDGDEESGITIHVIDEDYDHGNIIFQARCPISTSDSAEDVAQKVHKLEYRYYPEVIEKMILDSEKG